MKTAATTYDYDASGRLTGVSHPHRQEGVRSAQVATLQIAGRAERGARAVCSSATRSGELGWAVRTSAALEYRKQAAQIDERRRKPLY